jgi:hypothetical protein
MLTLLFGLDSLMLASRFGATDSQGERVGPIDRYRLYVRVYVPLQISIISITLFLVMLDGPSLLRGVM